MENLVINRNFWKNKRVFLTGHTGFKGGWLALWLSELGSKVYGYSLRPPTNPNFFSLTKLKDRINNSEIGNICNLTNLKKSIKFAKPSIVIHMAAQPIVKTSYLKPLETFQTNLIGTLNLFEAIKSINTVEAILNITSDKCYENQNTLKVYHENDKLGGSDPYSASKACSEIASEAYRKSFFLNNIKLATARAGNVIGGGDWAKNRLIPDIIRSIKSKRKLILRAPNSVRPWQHVLDPLSGYLCLLEKLVTKGNKFAEAWNFGPKTINCKSVKWITDKLSKKFNQLDWHCEKSTKFLETKYLKIDIKKSTSRLGWYPKWNLKTAIDHTINWYDAYNKKVHMDEFSINQIKKYLNHGKISNSFNTY